MNKEDRSIEDKHASTDLLSQMNCLLDHSGWMFWHLLLNILCQCACLFWINNKHAVTSSFTVSTVITFYFLI